jgi:hypothetical protein
MDAENNAGNGLRLQALEGTFFIDRAPRIG